MKKKLFAIIAIAAIATSYNVSAGVKTTTTINVPGTAKSVMSSTPPGGATTSTVDCDPSNSTCFSKTTTTESDLILRPGDKVEISGTTDAGEPFDIVGGYIDISSEPGAGGSTIHNITLSESWNE